MHGRMVRPCSRCPCYVVEFGAAPRFRIRTVPDFLVRHYQVEIFDEFVTPSEAGMDCEASELALVAWALLTSALMVREFGLAM